MGVWNRSRIGNRKFKKACLKKGESPIVQKGRRGALQDEEKKERIGQGDGDRFRNHERREKKN